MHLVGINILKETLQKAHAMIMFETPNRLHSDIITISELNTWQQAERTIIYKQPLQIVNISSTLTALSRMVFSLQNSRINQFIKFIFHNKYRFIKMIHIMDILKLRIWCLISLLFMDGQLYIHLITLKESENRLFLQLSLKLKCSMGLYKIKNSLFRGEHLKYH